MQAAQVFINYKYNNAVAAASNYRTSTIELKNAAKKPDKQYKTVNQLLKECPLLGTTRLGLNFIA